jgi:hypothetical protein
VKHIFSRTVVGALLFAVARIVSEPRNPQAYIEGVGLVVSAYGVRSAVAKNGRGN